MTFLIFIISAFAVYRLADLLADDEGPFSIFTKLRRKVPSKTNAGRGVRCPYCIGIHVAALVTAALWWIGEVPGNFTPIYGFGLAGAQASVRKAVG